VAMTRVLRFSLIAGAVFYLVTFWLIYRAI
jgi:hypothetical protein